MRSLLDDGAVAARAKQLASSMHAVDSGAEGAAVLVERAAAVVDAEMRRAAASAMASERATDASHAVKPRPCECVAVAHEEDEGWGDELD